MKLRHCMSVFVLVLLSLAAAAQQKVVTAASGGGSASPSNVLVVNSTAQPVPTAAQGTTTVAGTVSIGNSPSVSLADGAIANTKAIDARSIVRLGITPLNTSGQNEFQRRGTTTTYYVPAGKRLVITSVSLYISAPATSSLRAYLWTGQPSDGTDDGASFLWFFDPHHQSTAGVEEIYATANPEFYVDENQPLRIFSSVRDLNGNILQSGFSGSVWASGYLVDCGTGCTHQ